MPKVALYAGSFDPITNGHADLIKRSLKFVDRLVVGVAVNIAKQPLFSTEERIALARPRERRSSASWRKSEIFVAA